MSLFARWLLTAILNTIGQLVQRENWLTNVCVRWQNDRNVKIITSEERLTMLSKYDQWRLSGPDEHPEIGMEEGHPCNRFPEPDEDMGRARQRRCQGEMIEVDGAICCDRCGETAV